MKYITETKPTASYSAGLLPILVLPGELPDTTEIEHDDGDFVHVWKVKYRHQGDHPGYTWFVHDPNLSYAYPSPKRVRRVQNETPALAGYYEAVMAEVNGGEANA